MIIDDLKKIIVNSVHLPISEKHTKNGIGTININDPSAKLTSVRIEGLNVHSTFAFKLDHKDYQLSTYLNHSEKYLHRGCDAVIYTTVEDKSYLFFIELKSFIFTEKNVVTKMKNSEVFLGYLHEILKTFYHYSEIDFQKRYILFHLRKNNKKGTRPEQAIDFEIINEIKLHKAYNYDKVHIKQLAKI